MGLLNSTQNCNDPKAGHLITPQNDDQNRMDDLFEWLPVGKSNGRSVSGPVIKWHNTIRTNGILLSHEPDRQSSHVSITDYVFDFKTTLSYLNTSSIRMLTAIVEWEKLVSCH